jgi:hypothetical protein
LVEQRTFNAWVAGSNPAGLTTLAPPPFPGTWLSKMLQSFAHSTQYIFAGALDFIHLALEVEMQ